MKNICIILVTIVMAASASAQGVTRNGQVSSTGSVIVSRTGAVGTASGVNANGKLVSTIAIGDMYQGGVIAYLLVSGDPGFDAGTPHGLIVTTSDQGSAGWGCFAFKSSVLIGGTGTEIGTGSANTTLIINGCTTTGIAARICADLSLNGYSDWYLPSKDELNKVYLNRSVATFTAGGVYYTSSEFDNQNAYVHAFGSGTQGASNKNNNYLVRAVRSF